MKVSGAEVGDCRCRLCARLNARLAAMVGFVLLISLVATPEALVLTGGVLLALVTFVTVNTKAPETIYVHASEKRAEFRPHPLKDVKLTADSKMVIDSNVQSNSSIQDQATSPLSSKP
jgi:hypothetical protein